MACSVCPWRCNHVKNDSPVSRGMAGARAAMARAIAELVREVQTSGAQEMPAVLCRGAGSARRLDHRGASARLKKSQPVVPANLVFDAQSLVELDQVGAAAEQHVLAVVHDFAGAGMLIRRSASAEIGTALEQGHAKAAAGQGRNRRPVPPVHLPPRLLGDFVPGARSSGQAFQEAFGQNAELLAHGEADLLPVKTSYSRSAIFSSSRR